MGSRLRAGCEGDGTEATEAAMGFVAVDAGADGLLSTAAGTAEAADGAATGRLGGLTLMLGAEPESMGRKKKPTEATTKRTAAATPIHTAFLELGGGASGAGAEESEYSWPPNVGDS